MTISSYCFICGRQLPQDEDAGGHYLPLPGRCPRYHRRGHPGVRWDGDAPLVAQWEFQQDRWDVADYDAVDYEPFSHASVSEIWQEASESLLQQPLEPAYLHIEHMDDQVGREWLLGWIVRLLIAGNHMLAMVPNGLGVEGSTVAAREASVLRRLRFTHHALILRFVLTRVRPHCGDLPGGDDLFDHLAPYSRALRFQRGAVPAAVDARDAEWARFHDIGEDQLNVQYPTDYLLEAARIDDFEARQAGWIRALLEPVRGMLPVIRRHRSAPTKAFSLSDSSTLRTAREELRKRMQALGERLGGIILSHSTIRSKLAFLQLQNSLHILYSRMNRIQKLPLPILDGQ